MLSLRPSFGADNTALVVWGRPYRLHVSAVYTALLHVSAVYTYRWMCIKKKILSSLFLIKFLFSFHPSFDLLDNFCLLFFIPLFPLFFFYFCLTLFIDFFWYSFINLFIDLCIHLLIGLFEYPSLHSLNILNLELFLHSFFLFIFFLKDECSIHLFSHLFFSFLLSSHFYFSFLFC